MQSQLFAQYCRQIPIHNETAGKLISASATLVSAEATEARRWLCKDAHVAKAHAQSAVTLQMRQMQDLSFARCQHHVAQKREVAIVLTVMLHAQRAMAARIGSAVQCDAAESGKRVKGTRFGLNCNYH